MSDKFRQDLIRLANDKPELREQLVPVLREAAGDTPDLYLQDNTYWMRSDGAGAGTYFILGLWGKGFKEATVTFRKIMEKFAKGDLELRFEVKRMDQEIWAGIVPKGKWERDVPGYYISPKNIDWWNEWLKDPRDDRIRKEVPKLVKAWADKSFPGWQPAKVFGGTNVLKYMR
jgi:hypothetical protein